MAFTNETDFINGLKTTPDQTKAIEALFNDPDFKKIWNYLKNCQKVIELKSVPGYKIRGIERFGGYSAGRKGELVINPAKQEHRDNPMEMVDTIIHECIHAVLDVQKDCGDVNYPFSKEITEIYEDSNIQGRKTSTKSRVDPRDKDYLDKHYGDSASSPSTEYIDINDKAQQLIIKIIKRLMAQTKVGKKTLTFENEEKRNPKKKGGCAKVILTLILITASLTWIFI
ncbi:MAG: hypothetical protein HKN48_10815 [Flavobacteriaceae bacterium]|nr:hypothetical protein [Flavobacteriaceae bacterium]